jgi:pimeloyl-ACP methyl ester carboxylesterase
MFRDLIPELADRYHVVAPDLPGFGMTEQPARDEFAYTFGNIANVIGRFTEVLGLKKFAVYVFDYRAPVGFRLAVKQAGCALGRRPFRRQRSLRAGDPRTRDRRSHTRVPH